MRFLKNKIARAQEKHQAPSPTEIPVSKSETKSQNPSLKLSSTKNIPLPSFILKKQQSIVVKHHSHSPSCSTSTCSSPQKKERSPNKNIVKNYARAMINFALSDLALPYLIKLIQNAEDKITLQQFQATLQDQKEKINSIKTLRGLLLITEEDDDDVCTFKQIFRDVCEIFVKLFSVNWIFNSKLNDKMIHLRYRFKILRRIRNPELFTYLENFGKRY